MDGSKTKTTAPILKNGVTAIAAGTKYHFIGAGGVGMSGLAKILLKNNVIVSGSDQTRSPVTDKLNQSGAQIKIQHCEDNFKPDTNVVVFSAAVKADNPELIAARRKGCPIYKYARMLGILMDSFDGVAIAGTHGKSTTGGWLVYLLKKAGLDVNFVIGADVLQLGTNSGTGDSNLFIAEACEYDRSFWNLHPRIAAILNVEPDHLDIYENEQNVVDAFRHFAAGIRDGGLVVANYMDSNVQKIMRGLPQIRFVTFGLSHNCDFYAENIELNDGLYRFDVYHKGRCLGKARISQPGRHNILNALAVVAIAVNCGADGRQIVEMLGDFAGMDRRLMLREQIGGITVIDDYAHHPTEIKASLAAIRQRYRFKRLLCVYQPHQYSRTRFLLDDFAESFKLSDITIVPEIYFVRDEQATKKVINAELLVERICRASSNALFIDGFSRTLEYLKQNTKADDLVVIMGAGDIWKLSYEYIQWLRENR